MMQLESFLLKGRPFPIDNSVTAIPGFLAEARNAEPLRARTTWTLSRAVRLVCGTEKAPISRHGG